MFGLSGNETQYIGGDWSGAEESYRWSDGKHVRMSMSVSVSDSESLVLIANVAGYITKKHPEVYVDVLIEEILVDTWFISSNLFKDYLVVIPAEVIPDDGKLDIEFVINNPISPFDLGESSDSRNLGLAFRDVSISAAR